MMGILALERFYRSEVHLNVAPSHVDLDRLHAFVGVSRHGDRKFEFNGHVLRP